MARAAPTATARQKRLTLDLVADMHRDLKVRCAQLNVPMAELLRALIEDALADEQRLRRTAKRIHHKA